MLGSIPTPPSDRGCGRCGGAAVEGRRTRPPHVRQLPHALVLPPVLVVHLGLRQPQRTRGRAGCRRGAGGASPAAEWQHPHGPAWHGHPRCRGSRATPGRARGRHGQRAHGPQRAEPPATGHQVRGARARSPSSEISDTWIRVSGWAKRSASRRTVLPLVTRLNPSPRPSRTSSALAGHTQAGLGARVDVAERTDDQPIDGPDLVELASQLPCHGVGLAPGCRAPLRRRDAVDASDVAGYVGVDGPRVRDGDPLYERIRAVEVGQLAQTHRAPPEPVRSAPDASAGPHPAPGDHDRGDRYVRPPRSASRGALHYVARSRCGSLTSARRPRDPQLRLPELARPDGRRDRACTSSPTPARGGATRSTSSTAR